MTKKPFLQRKLPVLGNLSPAETLPEIVVGLVMVIGITSTARLDVINTDEGVNNLLTVAFSTALAWAIIDAALYLMNVLFQRGRLDLVASTLRASSPDASERRALVRGALDSALDDYATPDAVDHLYDAVAENVAGRRFAPRLRRSDLLAAGAIVVLVLATTLPPIIPFLLPLDPDVALDLSNAIAIASLFLIGTWWAPFTTIRAGIAGVALALIGSAMVGLTVLLEVN
ncbi:hypothetical protein [Subtercola boreus]|uniref:VIT family protein n=1 Tax=Subtercola boreus TaxID=120213 RepID=A0A3E0WAF9_9MICO|nr:hypothetical protein [Subtercola boreus]RFA21012.1 hypothetical protein B7R24_06275 [Subtercola boreus]RFA21396.1 hypothetical protein B7R23_06220 [Subtercola boreus]RFA27367.1 hypothetical protein B7R25_06345 [Subtercola boreus]